MKKKNDVEVLIDGRKYTLCGFESPEYIQKIASYINRKLAEFHKQEGYARLDLDLRNTLLAIITKRRKRQANTAPRLS